MGLSEKRKLLLLKGMKNNGKLTAEMARQLYSSSNAAQSALASLEFQGYIGLDVPGVFEVKKAPNDVKERYKETIEEEE